MAQFVDPIGKNIVYEDSNVLFERERELDESEETKSYFLGYFGVWGNKTHCLSTRIGVTI